MSGTGAADLPQPKRLLPTDVVVTLSEGRHHDLVGAQETDQVDFKSRSYELSRDKDKQDLVADVAAFANARGGILVLGVETAEAPAERVEMAVSFEGHQLGAVSEEQYRKVLHDRITPLVRDVRFRTFDAGSNDGAASVVTVIEIPAQPDRDKPFIVDRLVNDDDHRISHAIGWPERSGDSTFWHPKERIQQLIATGHRFGEQLALQNDESNAADVEMEAAWAASGVEPPTPRLSVQLVPQESSGAFADFFGRDAMDLRQWAPLRSAGFGWSLQWHAPQLSGNRFVASDDEAALLMSRDGIVTVATSLRTRSFMWGASTQDVGLPLNRFAVTEWITEVVRLAYEFVGGRLYPANWEICVVAHDLLPDPVVSLRPVVGPFIAPPMFPANATTKEVGIRVAGTGNWQTDSYLVLAEFYGQGFGQPPPAIIGADPATKTIDLLSLNNFR